MQAGCERSFWTQLLTIIRRSDSAHYQCFSGLDRCRQYNPIMRKLTLALLVCFLGVSGCDWVDSTGRESNSDPVAEIQLDDATVSGVIPMEERSTMRITAQGSDADGVISVWQWSATPVTEGSLASCTVVNGFNQSLAANSLQEACVNPDSCNMEFNQQDSANGGDVAFLLNSPELKAPVGVTYSLTAIDNDGGRVSNDYTFCILSINEAPIAVDDSFTVLEGEVLDITGDMTNLLSNDIDDQDVTNSVLHVVERPRRPPASANVFELRSDGGFSYSFAGTNLTTDVVDTFEYEITDGLFSSTATVSLQIVAFDDAPVVAISLPELLVTAGIEYTVDFGDYFSDPEGSTLSYAIVAGSLPPSGGLTLLPTGVFSGIAESFDEGEHDFSITVSDGKSAIGANVLLTIIENLAVELDHVSVQDVVVGETFSFASADFFYDPERQPLQFAVVVDSAEVSLTINRNTGVVRGFVSEDGSHTVLVSASDGYTPVTYAAVEIIATQGENNSPVFAGSIGNQTIELGEKISAIGGHFNDPDGDLLSYSLLGRLPTGLVFSAAGILSGRPKEIGVFAGLRIVAIDEGGLAVRSNAFKITIVEADN